MSDHALTIRGNSFFYRLTGTGQHTLVMLHGHNRDGDDFAAVIDDLARDVRVFAPDLRVHGRSEAAPFDHPATLADLAQDVHAMLGALGIERPVMLGHSMGGMITLDYWRQYPRTVQALVLDDSFPDFAAGLALLGNLFAPSIDPALRERIMAKSEASAATGRVPESLWQSILAFNARPWLAGIDVPVLAFLGDRGWIGLGQLGGVLQTIGTALIPILRVETFAGCGHFTQLEQPARYGTLLKDFLC